MELQQNQNQIEENSLNIARELSFLFEKIAQKIQNFRLNSEMKKKVVLLQNGE